MQLHLNNLVLGTSLTNKVVLTKRGPFAGAPFSMLGCSRNDLSSFSATDFLHQFDSSVGHNGPVPLSNNKKRFRPLLRTGVSVFRDHNRKHSNLWPTGDRPYWRASALAGPSEPTSAASAEVSSERLIRDIDVDGRMPLSFSDFPRC